MNAGAPTCGSCGGLNTNPQSPQCRFCGQMLPQAAPQPQAYGAPQGYGGYGGPPMQQPMPQGYNPQMQGYGPNPYGGPQPNPYGQPYVQPFQGGNGYIQQSSWASGWSTFFWIRLGIAAVVVLVSVMGACVSAIAGH